MKTGWSFVAGALFGTGLLLGGMADPDKVRGFLDVWGRWDPSLAFVMLGAIAVFAPAFRFVERGGRSDVVLPRRLDVDTRLVAGAALFGVGWGLSGYCPGPAIVGTAGLAPAAAITLAAMLAGIALVNRWERRA